MRTATARARCTQSLASSAMDRAGGEEATSCNITITSPNSNILFHSVSRPRIRADSSREDGLGEGRRVKGPVRRLSLRELLFPPTSGSPQSIQSARDDFRVRNFQNLAGNRKPTCGSCQS